MRGGPSAGRTRGRSRSGQAIDAGGMQTLRDAICRSQSEAFHPASLVSRVRDRVRGPAGHRAHAAATLRPDVATTPQRPW
jgi:hypothetical protein